MLPKLIFQHGEACQYSGRGLVGTQFRQTGIISARGNLRSEIRVKINALPILTVGEDDQFARNGGMIDFVLKNDHVRLSINLKAAKQAGLAISSRLLAVADEVKGKTD